MGRILLNGDHDSKGKIMLTALDSSNAVLTQFLMVDEWDCSPHHLHSDVTRESSDLALIPFTLLAWTHLLSSHRSNLDHSKALTQSFDSLSALLVHFTFHSSSRLVLWKSVSTPWRLELTLLVSYEDLCWLLTPFFPLFPVPGVFPASQLFSPVLYLARGGNSKGVFLTRCFLRPLLFIGQLLSVFE